MANVYYCGMGFQQEENYELDPQCCFSTGKTHPDKCVLMLGGRGQGPRVLPSYYHSFLNQFTIVGAATVSRAWYPQPNGVKNQKRALDGMPHAISLIEAAVGCICQQFKTTKQNIILLGYSAGGVMAIQVAANSAEPYAGVVCQSGAILLPKKLPICSQPVPILLTHSRDDMTFEWDERYLPMKIALKKQKYPLVTVESSQGGHDITQLHHSSAVMFINRCFGVF